MKLCKRHVVVLGSIFLTACVNTNLHKNTENFINCADVYTTKPDDTNLYQLLITNIDDKAYPIRPDYKLKSGEHILRVVELINNSELKIDAKDRHYIDLKLTFTPNTSYYLGAKYLSNSDKYWQPVIWQQVTRECKIDAKK